MNCFVPFITSITLETMMIYNTALLVIDMFLIPAIGNRIIKYDGVKIMTLSSLVLATTIIPLFAFLPQSSLTYVLFVRVWIVFWGVVFLCPMNYWYRGLFQTSDQYLMVGMGGALGSTLIGRFTIPICLSLWYYTEWAFSPAIFLAIVMLAAAGAVYRTSKEEQKTRAQLPA